MQRTPRSRRAALAVALLLALSAPQAAAAQAATPAAPTARLAYTAKILIATNVFTKPGQGIKLRLPTHAQWGGGQNVLLVLDTMMVNGTTWLRVALPNRPNGSSGWIREDFVTLSTSRWRITVNRDVHTVTVYRDGRKLRSFPAVIGAAATPTPRGLYAIYEKLPQPDPKGFLGPWALHLTAFSNVLLNYGGGPGRVAIHGRDGASLADPLGSSASHGCVRVDDANVIWMAHVVPLGTPVLITGAEQVRPEPRPPNG
jgi:lipoprotein-anchoring transpeptidase ErfK/SrfK